jgi:hypothetical protein
MNRDRAASSISAWRSPVLPGLALALLLGFPASTAAQIIISEFRVRGPNGANDEFIELYNNSGADHTVVAASGTGYGVAASNGVTRCSIPNGTVLPRGGHYLCVNSVGYSLASYPAGNGTTATANATYTTDIPDNAGIAVFNNNTGGASYSLANRLDAVGSTSEANTVYKEGAGYPTLTPFSIDYSFFRKPAGGCTGAGGGNCGSALLMQSTGRVQNGVPADTNNNANDFVFVDTNGTSAGAGQRLGAPGPENLSSPGSVAGPATATITNLDTCVSRFSPPNKVRDFTSDPANNSTFGTLDLRTVFTNNTGADITRLRFRIYDLSTFPAPSGVSDLRPRTSTAVVVTVDRPPCGSGTSNVTVQGTTLEQPPSQPNGSGFNGTLSANSVTLATPLANGAGINVRMLLGIQQTGMSRFCVVAETLPVYTSTKPFCYIGQTDNGIPTGPHDFDGDIVAEMPVYNGATGQWKVLRSLGGYTASTTISWGGAGYTPVPGDYDGDGKQDAAIYQTATGVWSILTSTSNYTEAFSVSWGGAGYDPVPGDYDGDLITDIAIYAPTTGFWYILQSTTSYTSSRVIGWGGTGYTAVGGQDFDGDDRSDLAVYYERTGTWSVLKSDMNFTTVLSKSWGGAGYTLVPGDYDGDGKSDFGLYQRRTGAWHILLSGATYTTTLTRSWGGMGFLPVVGDFDGDAKIDITFFRPSTNVWSALKSSTSYTTVISATFGSAAENPISAAVTPATARDIKAGDFDGDGISDMTVYHSPTGGWSTLTSSSGFAGATFGGWGGAGYTPVGGDYDGDGKGDLGLYQESTGTWLILLSGSGFTTSLSKGAGGPGYIPVPGDYDGDGKADFVVYNTTTGLWFGLKSSTGYTTTVNVGWGGTGYTAAPGDFDGDGNLDLTVYHNSTGTWSILTSSSNYTASITRGFGGSGFAPVQGDFDGDGFADFGVYQTSTGNWSVLKSSTGYTTAISIGYGGSGYSPVAGDWDGDGRADLGVYQASTGNWSILLSNGNYTSSLGRSWGGAAFTPIPVYP